MASKGMVKWAAGWFAPDVVLAAYRGLLGRNPTEAEVQAHVATIKRDGKVSAVVRDISRLPEAWAQALHAQPAELARQLYRGVNSEEPGKDSLDAAVRQLQQQPDLPALLASLVADRRRRLQLLELDTASVVQSAFKASLGRPADAADVQGFSAQLLASGNLDAFLDEVEHCAEHQAKLQQPLLAERTRTVQGLYRGLLGREAAPEELEAKLQALADGTAVEDLVRELMRLPEHQDVADRVETRCAALVQAGYQAMLHRAPEADPLARFTGTLAEGGSTTEFLRAVSDSEEHWVRLVGRRADGLVPAFATILELPELPAETVAALVAQLADTGDLVATVQALRDAGGSVARPGIDRAACAQRVTAVYQALLGREPDPDGLAQFTEFLANGGAELDFLNAVEASEERWAHVIGVKAEWFVRVAFLALLQREPEPEALAHFAHTLRETRDLRAFVAEVGFCREHREKLLRAVAVRKSQ